MKLLASVLVILAILIALRIYTPKLGSSVALGFTSTNGISQLGDCPNTPNCQGSESTRSKQQTDRFELNQSADQAISTLATIITTFPGAAIVEQTDRYLHATFTTRLMGFVDDAEFLLSDDKQSIQVRSASRLGKSDLGANAARISGLRAASNGKL